MIAFAMLAEPVRAATPNVQWTVALVIGLGAIVAGTAVSQTAGVERLMS